MYEVYNSIKLPLRNLEKKEHLFNVQLNNGFFLSFGHPEILAGYADATLKVEKFSNFMNVELSFSGEITVICDRCLENLEIPVEGENILSVRFKEGFFETEEEFEEENLEDIMYVSQGDDEIDLGVYVYESICLAMPIQRVHDTDKKGKSLCNPEMLKYLSTQEEKEITSPFSILKDIEKK